jgi:heterodisulfide reductase subunit A
MGHSDDFSVSRRHGSVALRYADAGGAWHSLFADLVVLAPAMVGSQDAAALAKSLGVPTSDAGFFETDGSLLDPVSTGVPGVYAAGCAQGPQDVRSSIAQGQAAAGQILSSLVPEQAIELEAGVAAVDPGLCGECAVCLSACAYGAVSLEGEPRSAAINEVLCRGCGACAAACPSEAIDIRHSTDVQMRSEVQALLTEPTGAGLR